MSSHHRSHLTVAALSAVLAVTGAAAACGSTHAASKPSATAAGTEPPQPSGRSASASPSATYSHGGDGARGSAGPGGARSADQASPRADQGSPGDDDDAELVVSREIVARCPKLSAVRQHVAELDPDMVWLAVLDSLGECMGAGEPLAAQNLGVSGDEEHRHVVREVLGSRGVAPTRVIATPTSAQGSAECQGGADCSKRVEITIAPAPQ